MAVSAAHQIPWDDYETWARAQWTHAHGPETGAHVQYKDMAAAAGYGPHRLIKAKRNGTIPLYAVRDYARGLGADPITALAAFTPIPLTADEPTPAQWLTQLHPTELHNELLRRLDHPVPAPADATFTPRPHAWATALLDGPPNQPAGHRGQRRKHAAHQLLHIPYNTLRTKERRGSWTIPELTQLCTWTGWHLGLALAVTGWLRWDEVGLDPQDRYAALRSVGGAELMDGIEAALPETRQALELAQQTLDRKERAR
ncbi:hypothetical protein M3E72_005050 [Micrococcus luteus]|nr:hypothetical protein [Micrococcus luteus]